MIICGFLKRKTDKRLNKDLQRYETDFQYKKRRRKGKGKQELERRKKSVHSQDKKIGIL